MKRTCLSWLCLFFLFTPVAASAAIKVFDRNYVFLGYLAGDGDINGNSSIRLFLPKSNLFVSYRYYSYMSLDIHTASLYYLTYNCSGQPYIEVTSTLYNEIRKLPGNNDLYVGKGNSVSYLNFNSRYDGSTCFLGSNVAWFMPAVKIADGTVPISLDASRLPLKFKWEEAKGSTMMFPVAVPRP